MLYYTARRVLQAIPVVLGVSVIVFALMNVLPGDAVTAMNAEFGMTPEAMARMRTELGLDQPIYIRVARSLWQLLQGDLGSSIYNNRGVVEQILEQLPATIQLAVASMVIGVVLGIVFGTLAAVRQNSWIDTTSMVISLVGVSMPVFWLGLLLIMLFSVSLSWLPATGTGGPETLIMPALALSFRLVGTTARLVRSSMLEVLHAEYVTTARAKGLMERVVLTRHALRNALIPVVTMVGIQFGVMLGGAVVIETVFGRQGIGSMAVQAIIARDYPLVQGVVLLTAVSYVVVNLLVDISYGFIDPRIRYD